MENHIEELLEKAHLEISVNSNEANKNQKKQEVVITQKAIANANATGGNNSFKQPAQKSDNSALA